MYEENKGEERGNGDGASIGIGIGIWGKRKYLISSAACYLAEQGLSSADGGVGVGF